MRYWNLSSIITDLGLCLHELSLARDRCERI